eukprot:gene16751-19096_t
MIGEVNAGIGVAIDTYVIKAAQEVVQSSFSVDNPQVYFDIEIEGEDLGRVKFELYANIVPRTAEYFRILFTGEKGFGYKGSKFHRIYFDMIEGGDITRRGDGRGGKTIFQDHVPHETVRVKHTKEGLLSTRPNSEGYQFSITTAPPSWLNDHHHTVFGEVKEGYDIVKRIVAQGTIEGFVNKSVYIKDCGEIKTE